MHPFDEMYETLAEAGTAGHGDEAGRPIRPHYQAYAGWLRAQSHDAMRARRDEAEMIFRRVGITFAVYGAKDEDGAGTERLIPFDLIPRIIPADEWAMLERGLVQRVTALNRFAHDVYHGQEILKAGLISAEQVLRNSQYRVAPVAHYPDLLLETLRDSSPAATANPTVVVLTPGMYNSAYFEHAFLAQQMGVELVEGQDLFVKDGFVYMRTTAGPQRVDVIYRRVDDDFIDPRVFRPDSTLGCAGLMDAYRAGHVTICNAIGTGVADDKSIYPYVPKMIEFYLGEQPILHNVPTYMCRDADDLKYVMANMHELVVKEVHGAGGYGMLVGPAASAAEIAEFRRAVQARPDGYIAQPTLSLSSCPTYVDSGIAPRHIDLRPFVLSGKEVQMVPGGLTRVALKEGSLVVNSSQGGGTKDTWVLEEEAAGSQHQTQSQAGQSQWQSQSQGY